MQRADQHDYFWLWRHRNAEAGTSLLALSTARNIFVGGNSYVTGIFDTQGNTISVPGTISTYGSYPGIGITKIGTGILILSGSNSYASQYTVSTGTLGVANDNGLGYTLWQGIKNYPSVAVSSGGTLDVNGYSPTGQRRDPRNRLNIGRQRRQLRHDWQRRVVRVGRRITGTGSVRIMNGSVGDPTCQITLSATSTFSGTFQQTAWTIVLANSLALQSATVDYNHPIDPTTDEGYLAFGTGVTTATLGGLQGGNNNFYCWGSLADLNVLNLVNSGGSTVTLTVGGNGANTTFWGTITACNTFGLNGHWPRSAPPSAAPSSRPAAARSRWPAPPMALFLTGTSGVGGEYGPFTGNYYSGGTQLNSGT